MWALLFFLLVGALYASSPSFAEKRPTKHDIGYFNDADELKPVETKIVKAGPNLPAYKKAFCSRTYEDQVRNYIAMSDMKYFGVHEQDKETVAIKNKIEFLEKNTSVECQNKESLKNTINELNSRIFEIEAYYEKEAQKLGLSWSNPSGFFGTGMCWFHSRFERAGNYLANPRPNLSKPDEDEAKKIIGDLISMDKVVELPGYASLSDFSKDWRREIEAAMDSWSVLTFPRMFVRVGDRASEGTPAEKRKRLMAIYERVKHQQEIIFIRYNFDRNTALGIHSHSVLVFDAKPIYEKGPLKKGQLVPKVVGYMFAIKDSNKPFGQAWETCRFDEFCGGPVAKGYIDFDDDLPSFRKALREYCE